MVVQLTTGSPAMVRFITPTESCHVSVPSCQLRCARAAQLFRYTRINSLRADSGWRGSPLGSRCGENRHFVKFRLRPLGHLLLSPPRPQRAPFPLLSACVSFAAQPLFSNGG